MLLLIYILLMSALVVGTLRKPSYAIAAVLTMFGLEQWTLTISSFFGDHRALGNVLVGGLVVMALVLRFVRQRPIFGNLPAVWWCVVALLFMAFVSRLWSVYPASWAPQWTEAWPYLLTIVLLTSMLFHEPEDLKDGAMATLAFGVVIMLLLVLTTEVGFRRIQLKYVYSMGKESNPLALAQMCGVVALIAILMNFRNIARFWQLARWFVVAIALALIFRSGSRGEFLALALTAILFVPLSRRFNNLKGLLTTIIAIVIFGVLVQALFQTLEVAGGRWQVESMEEAFRGGRVETTTVLLGDWLRSSPFHWFLGLGNSAAWDPQILGVYPHMVPMEILAEEGIIGFALFCGICVLSVRAVIRTYPLVQDHPDALGVLATFAGILFFRMVLSCKTGSLLTAPTLWLFAILLGKYELSVRRFAKASRAEAEAAPQPTDLASGALLGARS